VESEFDVVFHGPIHADTPPATGDTPDPTGPPVAPPGLVPTPEPVEE
jgi:hypothetical protein